LSKQPATPLRQHGTRHANGWVLLRDHGLDYRDGTESRLLEIVESATDISSSSDELLSWATDWPTRAHLDPARANLLRALDLPADARVLEVGAGCGAVTRYLGESCATVDAVEPVIERAAVARSRTRDLPGVEVFVGDIDDVPNVPCYDLVFVVGVLEYMGGGSSDPAPYVTFLRSAASRLAPGGRLVLAIENKLGVKYLAGAPEDHTDRVFDSIEGYPSPGAARTFSRAELTALLHEAGLTARFHGVFPDYKITRVVLGEFPESARSLLYRIPVFPSPDWQGRRPRLADERSLWRQLVEAGLDADFPNSFVVVATAAEVESETGSPGLWPDGQVAVFFSIGRKAEYSTRTAVQVTDRGIDFRREVGSQQGSAQVEPYIPGRDFLDLLADPGIEPSGLLEQWTAALDTNRAPLDLVPHNLVVDDSGRVHPIDQELDTLGPTDQVLRRGIYWLAQRGAVRTTPERWPGVETVGDLARLLGSLVGLIGDWLTPALQEEAQVQAQFVGGRPATLGERDWIAAIEKNLAADLALRLTDLPLGRRLPHAFDEERKALLNRHEEELAAKNRHVSDLEGWLAQKDAELHAAYAGNAELQGVISSMQATRLWRLGTGYWNLRDRLLRRSRRRS
jgi:SAM-dependent methyltransferase